MGPVRKDHSFGAGTGAVAGAVTGAAIGSAAGPVGTALGAIAGSVLGAKAGDSIAEAINPTEYGAHFEREFRSAERADAGRGWDDYAPAYRYGYDTHGRHAGRRFDEVEAELERGWAAARGDSQLDWAAAREPVQQGWQHLDRARAAAEGERGA